MQNYDRLCPDAVLLDLMMPDYDGLYALKEIRRINPESVILIASGRGHHYRLMKM